MSLESRRLTAEIETNRREIERLKPIIAEGQRFAGEGGARAPGERHRDRGPRTRRGPSYLLDAMADTLPRRSLADSYGRAGASLRIAGTTYSSVALSDFMANLKASGQVQGRGSGRVTQDLTKSPRTITFEVACRFEI